MFQGPEWGKKYQLGLVLIWHSKVWIIGKMHNKVVFCQDRKALNHWMNLIIGMTWKRVHAHASGSKFSLVGWECDSL